MASPYVEEEEERQRLLNKVEQYDQEIRDDEDRAETLSHDVMIALLS